MSRRPVRSWRSPASASHSRSSSHSVMPTSRSPTIQRLGSHRAAAREDVGVEQHAERVAPRWREETARRIRGRHRRCGSKNIVTVASGAMRTAAMRAARLGRVRREQPSGRRRRRRDHRRRSPASSRPDAGVERKAHAAIGRRSCSREVNCPCRPAAPRAVAARGCGHRKWRAPTARAPATRRFPAWPARAAIHGPTRRSLARPTLPSFPARPPVVDRVSAAAAKRAAMPATHRRQAAIAAAVHDEKCSGACSIGSGNTGVRSRRWNHAATTSPTRTRWRAVSTRP